MYRFLNLLTFIFFFESLFAQNYAEGCDGTRYAYPINAGIKKSTIQYATSKPESQALFMDIYEPENDAGISKRPLILFAHGGSFISGDKADMEIFCSEFTNRGFTTASIQYRLMDGSDTSQLAIINAVLKAVSDMKGAYRFFKEDAASSNIYKIDTSKIMIGGISAGAITALHTAYLDKNDSIDPFLSLAIILNGGYNGNTGDAKNLRHTTRDIFGVFNFSGAIVAKTIFDNNEPFLMSYHGEIDNIVPIDSINFFNIISLYGSRTISNQLKNISVDQTLTVVPGGSHTDIYTDIKFQPNFNEFKSASLKLYYPKLCGLPIENKYEIERIISTIKPNLINNTATMYFHKNIDRVLIYNQFGTLLRTENVNNNLLQFQKNGLKAGIYYAIPVIKDQLYKPESFIITD